MVLVRGAGAARRGAEPDPADLPRARGALHRAPDRARACSCVPARLARLRLRRDGARDRRGAAAARGARRRRASCREGDPARAAAGAARRRRAERRAGALASSTPRAPPPTRRARGTPTRRCCASFRGLVRVLELRPDDRIALVFPFTHVGGIGWLFAGLLAGLRARRRGGLRPEDDDPAARAPRRHARGRGHRVPPGVSRGAARAAPDAPLFPRAARASRAAARRSRRQLHAEVQARARRRRHRLGLRADRVPDHRDEHACATRTRSSRTPRAALNPPERRDRASCRRDGSRSRPGRGGRAARARPAALPRLPRRGARRRGLRRARLLPHRRPRPPRRRRLRRRSPAGSRT